MDPSEIIRTIAISILPLIFAITVHEVAHGYMASFLGDKTAKILGRLTLNPIKHMDLIGTFIVPVVLSVLGGVIIGWAKPVPINSRNLMHPRRDLALIAAAGPLSNLVMALIWAGIAKTGAILVGVGFPAAIAIYVMGIIGIKINFMLMVLNLLPIPQLDGGHIIASLLPQRLATYYEGLTPYGFIILLVLLALGILGLIISPAVNYLSNLTSYLFHL